MTESWNKIFSTQFFDEFPAEEYPLLFRIMRLFEHKISDGVVTSEYDLKILVKGNILMPTGAAVDHKNLLNELDIFKEECDKKEKDLVSVFVQY